jgi:hypothetical protein
MPAAPKVDLINYLSVQAYIDRRKAENPVPTFEKYE